MAGFRTLDDLEVAGKRVLVRADLNVPMRDGEVSDATRLERLAPTVAELRGRGARVVLLSHFGRPKGRPVPEMSLRPVLPALSRALGGVDVGFAEDCIGAPAEAAVGGMADGDVVLLENLRFHPEEEANDLGFATSLAKLGDFYVNDAFSAAHRAHASTEAIAHLLPAAAGRSMQAELDALGAALEMPERPVAAVIGGAKVSTKLDVLGHLIGRVDHLIIGGAMANTFLHARGLEVGASLCERDLAGTVREIEHRAEAVGCRVVLPTDVVVAAKLAGNVDTATIMAEKVPADMMILDIGPRAAAELETLLAEARTLVWNGPLGAFETPPFDAGTVRVARAAAKLTKAGKLVSVAGGGDTVAALNAAGVADDFTYVSSAGGAFLEWLEGKELPGVQALQV